MATNISLDEINRLVEERLRQPSRRAPSHDSQESIEQRLKVKAGMLFLLRLAKADLAALQLCTDSSRNNLIGLGGLVFFTGTVAFLSSWYTFATMVFPRGEVLSWIFGMFLALIYATGIMLIDREIVSSIRNSAVMFIGRLIFATIVSLAVSYPVKLLFFDGEIQRAIRETVKAEFSKQLGERETIKKRQSDNIDELRRNLQSEIKQFQGLLEEQKQIIAIERKPEFGRCQGKCERAQEKSEKYAATIAGLREKMGRLEEDHPVTAENQKASDALDLAINREVEGRQDLMSKWRASDIVKKDVGPTSYWTITFFVIAFFWCLEMIPVLMKSVIGKSEYNYYLEARQNLNSQKIVSITNLYMEAMQDADHPENVLKVPSEVTEWMHASMEDEKVPYRAESERNFASEPRPDSVARAVDRPPVKQSDLSGRDADPTVHAGNRDSVPVTPVTVPARDETVDDPPRG